tara:strand:+ start:147 stop:491 length:345 start_codon:yes stop_codon:yes gene_type:complete
MTSIISDKRLNVIPLSEPAIIGNEWKYIKECLDTGWISSVGSYVNRLEKMVVECSKTAIVEAIDKAINDDFKELLKGMMNPYGEGGASEKITEKLKTISLDEPLTKKRFYEISQ